MNAKIQWPVWTTSIAAVLLVSFISMLSYLIWFEPPWLVYKNRPFPVLNSPVKRGEAVKLEVSRCSASTVARVYGLSRRLECADPLLKRELMPSLQAGITSIEPGCNVIVSSANILPVNTPIGWCRIIGYGETQGVIRTHSVEWESKWFEVIE